MILSYFTAPSADDCSLAFLAALKSDCVPRLFACCEVPPFEATPTETQSIDEEKAA